MVEDDPTVADLSRLFLVAAGFDVELVTTGEAAIACLQERPGAFDGAIVDVDLPDISGKEVVAAAVLQSPDCAIVVVCGGDGRDAPPGDEIVLKPYGRGRLVAAVKKAITDRAIAAKAQRKRAARPRVTTTG